MSKLVDSQEELQAKYSVLEEEARELLRTLLKDPDVYCGYVLDRLRPLFDAGVLVLDESLESQLKDFITNITEDLEKESRYFETLYRVFDYLMTIVDPSTDLGVVLKHRKFLVDTAVSVNFEGFLSLKNVRGIA